MPVLQGSRQSPNRLPARCIQLDTGFGSDGVTPSKFTKRGQYCAVFTHYKAWQSQTVTPHALQLHSGVQVASKHRVAGMRLGVMTGCKRAQQVRLVHHADVQLRRRITGAAVVVAAYQYAIQICMALPPGF